jgi:hypothetical protein
MARQYFGQPNLYSDPHEMPDLKLLALDSEDLGVIAATTQDAVVRVADMGYAKTDRRFALLMNRYAWEESGKQGQRKRAALHFDRVNSAQVAGIDTNADGGRAGTADHHLRAAQRRRPGGHRRTALRWRRHCPPRCRVPRGATSGSWRRLGRQAQTRARDLMPVRLDTRDAGFGQSFETLLNSKREASEEVGAAVAAIIADVRARGDAAVLDLTAKFDRFPRHPRNAALHRDGDRGRSGPCPGRCARGVAGRA